MTIKYLQLNVWFGGKLHEQIKELIKVEQPDIIAFQEVFPDKLLPELQRSYGYTHVDYAPEFYDSTWYHTDFGTAILSTFPIINSQNIFYSGRYEHVDLKAMKDYSTHPHAIQHCEINCKGTIINVFTHHGIWGFDDKDNEKRYLMSKKLIEITSDKHNVVLSGDLNTEQNTKAIQDIERHLINPFRGKMHTSFNVSHMTGRKGTFDQSVIDFIFVSRDINVVESYIPEGDVSDHLPLIVVFEL